MKRSISLPKIDEQLELRPRTPDHPPPFLDPSDLDSSDLDSSMNKSNNLDQPITNITTNITTK